MEEQFLADVTALTKIRHENIALFMGACLEPPNLLIVSRLVVTFDEIFLYESGFSNKREGAGFHLRRRVFIFRRLPIQLRSTMQWLFVYINSRTYLSHFCLPRRISQ